MQFTGFTETDFETFAIEGLEGRMEAIRSRIQPKFGAISSELLDEIAVQAGEEMYLHIAKHARRKVNPPVDTWMSFSSSKRGYKQLPHFQIGLFDDRVFIWLALIYELPNKQAIAQTYLDRLPEVRSALPEDFVLSFDHMQKDAVPVRDLDDSQFEQALRRFRDVKKVELLVGRNIPADDPVLADGQAFLRLAKETMISALPLYKMAKL
ncbi:DUF1054 domain-containing protein [Paenibacillus oleatilyticus]|uniref:UPF0637 protein ACEU3E_26160 n=1 Tax=Paenibacillus oleatilyticus TaxID=2594886 RepID=A0ABV4V6F9_9BACL